MRPVGYREQHRSPIWPAQFSGITLLSCAAEEEVHKEKYTVLLTSTTMASIDDDLAQATSQRLSMGSSVVEDCKNVSCVLPSKLHPSLYNNSLGDVSMMLLPPLNNNINNSKGNNEKREQLRQKLKVDVGVPGFPDFPGCWQGTSSAASQRKGGDTTMHHADKKHSKKCIKTKRQIKRQQQRQIVRKAVNTSGIPKSNQGKVIKNILRNERRLRRIERVVKLQERR